MKNKLRVGALLLTAVMLVSGVYESAPIVVLAEEQTEIEQEALQTVNGENIEEKIAVRSADTSEMVQVYGKDMEKQNKKAGFRMF